MPPPSPPHAAEHQNKTVLARDEIRPGLYVTATPIGNLKDMTYRAVAVMKAADYILCEDTRQTGKLCAAYAIATSRRPYHDHNGASVRPGVIADLVDGATVCLVSDAGTPLISDPGYKLVAAAQAAGVHVSTAPGACAAVAALCVAGLPTDRFLFAGFPPAKTSARDAFLAGLKGVDATIVFYESGGRIRALIDACQTNLPGRTAAVARELTKRHEETIQGSYADLLHFFDHGGETRGEFVCLLSPPDAAPAPQEDLEQFMADALDHMTVRDAAAAAAETFGIGKKRAYQTALAMAKDPAKKDATTKPTTAGDS